MHDLTDDVALMRPVIDALRASGADVERVLARVGLSEDRLPTGRIPHAAQALFWKAAAEECGDADVGLYLAQHQYWLKTMKHAIASEKEIADQGETA